MKTNSSTKPEANGQIRRFDFFALQDFAKPAAAPEPEPVIEEQPDEPPAPPPPPTFSEEELEQAKQEAYNAGVGDGKQQAKDQQQQEDMEARQQLKRQLKSLGEQMASAQQAMQEQIRQQEQELLAFADALSRKLALQALTRNPQPVLENIIQECLPQILSQPALLVKTAEDTHQAVEESLNHISAQHGYSGSVTVKTDHSMKPGDIRLEWQFGAAERRLDQLFNELDRLLYGNAPASHQDGNAYDDAGSDDSPRVTPMPHVSPKAL